MTEEKHPVLIVDDDPGSLELLNRHLSEAGYEVLKSSSAEEALAIALARGPRIVITDWIMPKVDGGELCRTLRNHEAIALTYIIVVTSCSQRDQITRAFECGADDYLIKPVDPSELIARLRAAERMIKLHRQLEAKNREVHRFNAEMAIAYEKLDRASEKLERLATTDELTGLINRRAAMNRLGDYWSTSTRFGDPISCILLDIDRFKAFNDTHGHAVGDLVLRETAVVLDKAARRGENVCRIGGEEFLVICPQSTELMAAVGAERLRRVVENHTVKSPDGTPLRVSISLGVAQRGADMSTPDDLLHAADIALYAAKRSGRNTVRQASQLALKRETSRDRDEPDVLLVGPGESAGLTMNNNANDETEPAHVLLVDSDQATRTYASALLEKENYWVVEADGGGDAVRCIEAELPDVIVVNSTLSDMNGLSCIRRIKEQVRLHMIPIILVRDDQGSIDASAAVAAGADEYITNPRRADEFVLRIRTMVSFRRELLRSNSIRGEQTRALELLLTFSRDIAAAESLDAVLDGTLSAVGSLTCSRRVAILLPDAMQSSLTIAKSSGISDGIVSAMTVPIGEAACGTTFKTQRTLVLNDQEEIRLRKSDADYDLFPGTPAVCTPLLAPEGVVGVLVISGRQGAKRFADIDLEYIDVVCNIAAAAIHDFLSSQARDEARDSIVTALATLAEYRDNETGKHLERVTRFCLLLAHELQATPQYQREIGETFLNYLERAAPLHDIGKVGIPDQILHKPGPLTDQETALMRTHTEIGATTIRAVWKRTRGAHFLTMAEDIARCHHEWYDGNGYPQGLSGQHIPLAARIAMVADVYDALTTQRVYKSAMSHERALELIISSSGTMFDPEIVAALLNCEQTFRKLAGELADRIRRIDAKDAKVVDSDTVDTNTATRLLVSEVI